MLRNRGQSESEQAKKYARANTRKPLVAAGRPFVCATSERPALNRGTATGHTSRIEAIHFVLMIYIGSLTASSVKLKLPKGTAGKTLPHPQSGNPKQKTKRQSKQGQTDLCLLGAVNHLSTNRLKLPKL